MAHADAPSRHITKDRHLSAEDAATQTEQPFARPTNSEAAYGTALDRGTGAPGPAASSYQTVCFILLWSMDGQSMGIITNLFQQPPSLSREAINAKNGPHLKSRLPVRVENRSTPSPCCACHSCCMPTPRLSPPLLYRLHASRR